MTTKYCWWLTATIVMFAMLLAIHVRQARDGHVSMTIRALGPTGETWYQPAPQPVWSFAITNTGIRNVEWKAGIDRSESDKGFDYAGGFVDWPEGILSPGQGLRTNMIVPAKSGIAWRPMLVYWPSNSRDFKTSSDEWHRNGP